MASMQAGLWAYWLGFVAALALVAAVPFVAGPEQAMLSDAQQSVVTFVLTLLSMTAGVGSLATRENVVRGVSSGTLDPRTPRGAVGMRRMLLGTWALCVVIALMGLLMAWLGASPWSAAPYVVAAATLLVFHAPRAGALDAAPGTRPAA